MKCPKCSQDSLDLFDNVEGVEVDFCSNCKSTWFDRGELAFYVETASDVPDLATALGSGKPTDADCPRCSTKLVETHYVPDNPLRIDICPSCHGILLEAGELPHIETIAAGHGGLKKVINTVKALEKKGYVVLGIERKS
ncbi:MAG: zf-TFIIB domain-containing protein [Deltaproteobacteria bacterium]|nr:zf-TFIIB domain-containing protein [Deltaproteobacteria bacterium]